MFKKDECPLKVPVFGMKKLYLVERIMNPESLDQLEGNLCMLYLTALMKAIVEAIGGKVLPILESESKGAFEGNHPFVRDPVVILQEHNLMLHTPGNYSTGAMDIVMLGKKFGYTAEKIMDAYFEGGNIFYYAPKKIFLHGIDPPPESRYSVCYIGSRTTTPQKTNEVLSKILADRGISVVGLEINPIIKAQKDVHDKYYHLDCFMQLLPDGRLVIVNKEILSKASQEKLLEIFGSNFIDLAYSGYLSPILFNFLSIPINDQIHLLSSFLPEEVIQALKNLQLKVITPGSVDATNPAYNRELAEKVAFKLQEEGFDATEGNLTTSVPKKRNGYFAEDGTLIPFDEIDRLYGSNFLSLNEFFREVYLVNGFNYGGGGPHCLIADIAPDISCLEQKNEPEQHLVAEDNKGASNSAMGVSAETAAAFIANDLIDLQKPSESSTYGLNGLFAKSNKMKASSQQKESNLCSCVLL